MSLSALAVSPARADHTEIDLNADRVQVVHSGGSNTDSTNININFTNNGEAGCDSGADDAIASGIEVALLGYTCYEYYYICGAWECPSFPFDYFVNPFVAHTVNKQTYATFYGLNPVDVGPGTVSARISLLSDPVESCGTWRLNLEATGLDLSSITSNPISLWLNDADDSGPFCYDIDNAIIGSPTAPTSGVRRGVRR